MTYRLYKKEYETISDTHDGVEEFTPSPRSWFIPGESRSRSTALVRFYFWLITWGKTKIFYLKSEDGAVLHTSCVLPKCYKFPFMKKGDYEIGPCLTVKEARGRGYYGTVLNHITHDSRFENASFYMLVDEGNTPSIKGIEKAGFAPDGYARRTKVLKRFRRIGDR